MNLMDCMMDEFHDEAKIKSMNENDICSWLEVCVIIITTTATDYHYRIYRNILIEFINPADHARVLYLHETTRK